MRKAKFRIIAKGKAIKRIKLVSALQIPFCLKSPFSMMINLRVICSLRPSFWRSAVNSQEAVQDQLHFLMDCQPIFLPTSHRSLFPSEHQSMPITSHPQLFLHISLNFPITKLSQNQISLRESPTVRTRKFCLDIGAGQSIALKIFWPHSSKENQRLLHRLEKWKTSFRECRPHRHSKPH